MSGHAQVTVDLLHLDLVREMTELLVDAIKLLGTESPFGLRTRAVLEKAQDEAYQAAAQATDTLLKARDTIVAGKSPDDDVVAKLGELLRQRDETIARLREIIHQGGGK